MNSKILAEAKEALKVEMMKNIVAYNILCKITNVSFEDCSNTALAAVSEVLADLRTAKEMAGAQLKKVD